ncbi:hypothetical protein C0Z18_05780 [Trinickia dabaoshanensis]|uniref:GNAT family N-acetyltransferase n=1 Tax=Trinickia dabaoshanensis TaxID=564714 RepID=A0A2N7VY08_9BURK|nr:hypothetical protein [Trinickia dabaoshanensis]PMS22028.1 hypothetical protein C0Z18_05780 [Trinickia dabaoshanensis]
MDHSLHFLAPPAARPVETEPARARLLGRRDLPALMELEREKWTDVQAASEDQLRERIDAHPELAIGAFCTRTGRLLASLFMRPIADDFYRHVQTWDDCVSAPLPDQSSTLFGISLSSRNCEGVTALLNYFWPIALKRGWRHIYLGSPVPGLRDWRETHPERPIDDYVHATRRGMPLDPQLRYYRSRGFTKIVCAKPRYFPHERSLDYGAILRGTVPLSTLAPLWAALPESCVRRVTRALSSLL